MEDFRKILDVATGVRTPFFVYDASTMRDKHRLLREGLNPQFEIFYALKSNPNIRVAQIMSQLGLGADVASSGELELAEIAGFLSEKISFAGPGKTEDELKIAIEKNLSFISIESIQELLLVHSIAQQLNKIACVGVRVNPARPLKSSGMIMGGESTQFGIDEEQLADFFRALKHLSHVQFKGLHVFAGSQILNHTVLLDSFENVMRIALMIKDSYGAKLDIINFGGGFGIPYFKNEKVLDIHAFSAGLKDLLSKYNFFGMFPGTRFFVEAGRYLVGESGYYVTKILYKKVSRGKTFLITDGGMNHHLAATGNLGQILQKNYHIKILNKIDEPCDEKVSIAGPLCTPLDILANNIMLPHASPGDLVCICNSGAYGYSASPLKFLSHHEPPEVVIE